MQQAYPSVPSDTNAPLRALFYRLSDLLNIATVPIFIFGEGRKYCLECGAAIPLPLDLVLGFKSLICMFGYEVHEVCNPCPMPGVS